ncbi:MAG: type II 3-dehydroquinate dehydratase [Alphaproteobacteria bacterium]|nr:type II 3-dehydroquinate dehydratase [Alphaproteobacteria bacterium]
MKKQPRILVLNGPNLNMLGVREPAIYGAATHKDVVALCKKTAAVLGLTADVRQSNFEGELVTWIQRSRETCQGIVINAGAYTHTSVAILDALLLSELQVIEVHISNIFRREHFRQQSFVSQAALGIISGLGIEGYAYAIQHLAKKLGPVPRKKA